jgi:hypothetical protein
MNAVDFIVDVIFWLFVIWLFMKMWVKYLIARNEILREDLEAVSKKIKETIVNVNIEKHGDIFYVFEKETNNFIAQGQTMSEIKEIMQKRFPKKTFVATEDHIKESGLEI